MSDKSKMLRARELIQQKRYREARDLLRGVDNPQARDWIAKLDVRLDDPFEEQVKPPIPFPIRIILQTIIIIVALVPAFWIWDWLVTTWDEQGYISGSGGITSTQSLIAFGVGIAVFLAVAYLLHRLVVPMLRR